jgi:bifunctional UDP-N-acetylglucosamine pyrophosphorylase/glucosamine-1-phosphate N-acetyltransferase
LAGLFSSDGPTPDSHASRTAARALSRQHPSTSDHRPLAAIILAAGKGTRMNSDLPKVAHEVAGAPMVRWVVEACREAGAAPIVLVVGHGADIVRDIFADGCDDIIFVMQHEQRGTGHAVMCASDALADFEGDVLVLAGDGPLIRAETIRKMRTHHEATGAAATLATAVIEDPAGYGRIVRDASNRFKAIVEDRDAAPEQQQIHEIYPSYACFDARKLFASLDDLQPNAKSGEYYITDLPAMLLAGGDRVELLAAVPPEDVLSINTPAQLAEVNSILTSRLEVKR